MCDSTNKAKSDSGDQAHFTPPTNFQSQRVVTNYSGGLNQEN